MNPTVAVVDFGREVLPYGVFALPGGPDRVGVAVDDHVLDLFEALGDECFASSSLNTFLMQGPRAWADARRRVRAAVARVHPGDPGMYAQHDVEMRLPIQVADFVDFFSGLEHATNAGAILRPGEEPLKPNWRYLPVGYHGRAGTVIASGDPVIRPVSQIQSSEGIEVAPTAKLDVEVELGYVVGRNSELGHPVAAADFADYVFGMVLLIDWSARDIQAWEYQPLGPFLAKSFATSISSWVVPLDALAEDCVDGPHQQPTVAPYLQVEEPRNYAVDLQFRVNDTVLTRPRADTLYWSAAQQLAHMTRNGARLRTGDLYGTGTISSFDAAGQGSLLELSANGATPVHLQDGSTRAFLEDGDTVTITATTGRTNRPLGQVSATISPALHQH